MNSTPPARTGVPANVPCQERWFDRLAQSLQEGALLKLTLGGHRGSDPTLRNVYVRPVDLRAGPHLSFVFRHDTRDVTKNHTPEEALRLIRQLVGGSFQHAHLFTRDCLAELNLPATGKPRLRERPVAGSTPTGATRAHDATRERLVDPQAPWLQALGVTGPAGKPLRGMEPKLRQIHRFVEMLSHVLVPAGTVPTADAPLEVIDMGCGKGYLTFATAEWLRQSAQPARVRGIDARADLVDLANQVARDTQVPGLSFACGSIADVPLERADVLVALHACDTATDDALARGIAAGARLLLTSPCCHREVRAQLRPPPVLAGALRHGILLEREAEFVTDALRAALLEWAGYTTRIFEFISPEHTGKNLMLSAVKRPGPGSEDETAQAAAAIRELAAFYGVTRQHLATRLGFRLNPEPVP